MFVWAPLQGIKIKFRILGGSEGGVEVEWWVGSTSRGGGRQKWLGLWGGVRARGAAAAALPSETQTRGFVIRQGQMAGTELDVPTTSWGTAKMRGGKWW